MIFYPILRKKIMATRKETINELIRNIKSDEFYFVNDRRCFEFIKANPENTDELLVSEKLSAMNNGVFESEDMPDLVEHFLSLNLDTALENGDRAIVPEIAAVKPSEPYKFRKIASMYCNFHRPEVYPVQTNIAEDLMNLFVEHVVPEAGLPQNLKPYAAFCQVVDYCMDMYDFHKFDYYEFEKFLWLKASLIRDYFKDPDRDQRFN